MSNRLDHLCKAKTKKGKHCRAAATAGGLCFFHANPNKASELGRKGGRSNRNRAESVDPLPRLENATAVRDAVDRLVADLRSGEVNPRVASVLATLLNLQLRAIETTDLEKRILELEKKLAEIKDDGDEGLCWVPNFSPLMKLSRHEAFNMARISTNHSLR